MNFSRPHVGAGKVKSQDKFKKYLFIGCVLLAGLGIFILSSVRRTTDRAMSGELVKGLSGHMSESGFISSVFEYFGSVTYVFPLIFVYAVWLLIMYYRPLKQINLFNLGLRLLGFNVLVLGLCGLFSGLFVAGNIGAGGILGDFINIISFKYFSHYVAAAFPVLLSIGGLMLLMTLSPLAFCEKAGALVFYVLTGGRDQSLQEKQNYLAAAQQVRKPAEAPGSEKASLKGKLFSTVYSKLSALKGKHKVQNVVREAHADLEPSFGDLKAPEDEPVQQRIEPVVEQSVEPAFVREVPNFYEGVDHSFTPESRLEQPYESEALRADLNAYHKDRDSYQREEVFTAPTDEEAPYHRVTYPEQFEEQSEEPRTPTTIIRDSRHEEVQEEQNAAVQNTIITKGSGLKGSFMQRESAPEEEGISTIITTHPLPQVKPEEVREPEGQSTIITRTEPVVNAVPASADEDSTLPNTAYALDSDSLATQESYALDEDYQDYFQDTALTADHSADPETETQVQTAADAEEYETAQETHQFTESEMQQEFEDENFEESLEDENIIAFDSLNEEQKEHTLEIKDEDLPASFVPSAQGAEFDGLRPNHTPVLSEKDNEYRYSNMQRGLTEEHAQREAQPAQEAAGQEETVQPALQSSAGVSSSEQGHLSERQEVTADSQSQIPSELLSTPKPRAVTEFATKDYDHSIISAPETPYGSWRPELELLRESESKVEVPYSEISERIARIDRFMQDFKVKAKVASYVSGPVITLFSLQLEGGISSRQIRSVSTDLTRYLMVKTIRVLDVVPGTQYVGLEVPNATRQTFTLRDVIKDDSYQHSRCLLPLCLGVNAIGKPVIADLAKAPHLLIAGTTGSGKSAGINAMLLSLLIKLSPAQLRLILIDPKRIEFSLYGDLPHLITPIIAEPEESAAALNWCVAEMERRYKLIEALGVRQLSEYNRVINEATLEGKQVYDPAWTADMGGRPDVLKPLPYLVIVVDEFADLMAMTGSQKKAEKSPEHLISRLTAKARAAGIHLILATQTPRADIVTGKIKANMPSRVAYTVQSNMESRIILDEQGAESLLGNGDMISRFMGVENYAPFRAHGPFASNDDVNAVVNAWKEHGAPEYIDGVTDVEDDSEPESAEVAGGEQKLDKLFDQVAAYAREFQAKNNREVSISAIQVQFSIGYTRSKRLMMQLQREGVI